MSEQTGTVISVNISDKKGVAKTPVGSCKLVADHGLESDAHSGGGHRQVSLLANESIERMKNRTGVSISPGGFAENLTTSGLELHTIPVGTRLTIGDCVLEITQIGKECHQGCAISKEAGICVMPLEGIFARVITGGIVAAGDVVKIIYE